MATILVNTNNVHRDEVKGLKERLLIDSWQTDTFTNDELKCLFTLVFEEFHKTNSDKYSELSDIDLINLRNKIKNFLP